MAGSPQATTMSRAWRRIRMQLIALVLGLTTALCVAWTCAAANDFRGWDELGGSELVTDRWGHRTMLHLQRLSATGREAYFGWCLLDHHKDFLPPEGRKPAEITSAWAKPVVPLRLSELATRGGIMRLLAEACGWRRPALWREYQESPNAPRPRPVGALQIDGVWQRDPVLKYRRPLTLPCRPIWSGLLANTALYAGAWGVILVLPGSLRRVLRRCRGRCIRCDYDLRGLTPGKQCPECGAFIPSARGRTGRAGI
jgi:hypothetical protein